MFFLVTYDIPADRRRTKVAKLLTGYGDRVQYSVFECDLTQKQIERLVQELTGLIAPEEDSLRIYRLCAECVTKVTVLGRAEPPAETPVVYIV